MAAHPRKCIYCGDLSLPVLVFRDSTCRPHGAKNSVGKCEIVTVEKYIIYLESELVTFYTSLSLSFQHQLTDAVLTI